MIRRPVRALVLVLLLAWALSATVFAGPASARVLHIGPLGIDTGNLCLSAALPCDSFDAAYEAAQPGDVVELAPGIYPSQTISQQGTSTKAAGPNIVFRRASSAPVTLGSVNVWASNVTLDGLKVTDVTVRPEDTPNRPTRVSGVILRNLDARNFDIFSATDVQVLGGDYGPASACGGPFGGGNNSIRNISGVNPSNIVLDGVTIHDVQSYDLGPCHTEGLAIFAGTNVTVRNSRFYGNSVYDIFMQANSGPISGVTLENNWFATPVGTTGRSNGTALASSGVNANLSIRNNSFNAPISLDDNGTNPTYSNVVLSGNVGDLPYNGCSWRGVSFSYNVWRNHKCGQTDVSLGGGPLPYRNDADDSSQDYHLTGGPAKDLIPAGPALPAFDIDGDTRPQNGAGDAGADEVAGGTTPPPRLHPRLRLRLHPRLHRRLHPRPRNHLRPRNRRPPPNRPRPRNHLRLRNRPQPRNRRPPRSRPRHQRGSPCPRRVQTRPTVRRRTRAGRCRAVCVPPSRVKRWSCRPVATTTGMCLRIRPRRRLTM